MCKYFVRSNVSGPSKPLHNGISYETRFFFAGISEYTKLPSIVVEKHIRSESSKHLPILSNSPLRLNIQHVDV